MLRWNKAQQGFISSIIKMRHRGEKLFREKVPLCDRLGHKLLLEHRLTKGKGMSIPYARERGKLSFDPDFSPFSLPIHPHPPPL